MGSVSSINPGLQNLLQTLSTLDPTDLSSPSVVAALEKAPASDIVQISAAATQLQTVDALFGVSNSSAATSGTDFSNILTSSFGENATTTPALAGLSAAQLASYASSLQASNAESLFNTTGTAATNSSQSDPLLNLLG
jgi:hypothetical protein